MFAVLRRSGGLEALGRKLAVEQPLVARAVRVLLPAILLALKDWTQVAGGDGVGVQALAEWLRQLGGGALAAKLITQDSVDEVAAEQLMGALFPSPDAKATLIRHAGVQSGVRSVLIDQLLRLLTVLVCGYIAARCEVAVMEGRDIPTEIAPLLATDDTNPHPGAFDEEAD